MQVSQDDSEADVDAQWKLITDAVASHTDVLLYHMPDHYSLVHAVREWTTTYREPPQPVSDAPRRAPAYIQAPTNRMFECVVVCFALPVSVRAGDVYQMGSYGTIHAKACPGHQLHLHSLKLQLCAGARCLYSGPRAGIRMRRS